MKKRAPKQRTIFCCGCQADVTPTLTDGATIYAHRPDLARKSFWRCGCGAYVGCHSGSTRPLGCIPDEPMRKARGHIHAILDPIWKRQRITRGLLYSRLTDVLGREYHTADLRTLDEARVIYRAIKEIRREAGID